MGSSVWLVLFIPYFVVVIAFNLVVGVIKGPEETEIRLPYDPDNGIVWTYEDDDPYLKLIDTEIDKNEQVFCFVNDNYNPIKSMIDSFVHKENGDGCNGNIMDVVFTSENGNERVFYARESWPLNEPKIYPAEDCLTTTFTCVAENPTDGAVWRTSTKSGDLGGVLCQPYTADSTVTFTVVALPEDINDGHCSAFFDYAVWQTIERYDVYFKIADGEITVSKIHN